MKVMNVRLSSIRENQFKSTFIFTQIRRRVLDSCSASFSPSVCEASTTIVALISKRPKTEGN